MGFFNFLTGKKNAAPPTPATPTAASAPAAQKANVLKSGIAGRAFTRGVNYVPAEEVADFAANTSGKRLTAYLNKARLNNAKLADKAAYVNTEFDYDNVKMNATKGPQVNKKKMRARFYGRNNANAAKTYRNFSKTLRNTKRANYNKKMKNFKAGVATSARQAQKNAATAAQRAAYEQAGLAPPVAKPSVVNSAKSFFTRKSTAKPANTSQSTRPPATNKNKPLASQAARANTRTLGPAGPPTSPENVEVAVNAAAAARASEEIAALPALPQATAAKPAEPAGKIPKLPTPAEKAAANAAKAASTTATVPPPISAAPPAAPSPSANAPKPPADNLTFEMGGGRRRMSHKKRHMKKHKSRKH